MTSPVTLQAPEVQSYLVKARELARCLARERLPVGEFDGHPHARRDQQRRRPCLRRNTGSPLRDAGGHADVADDGGPFAPIENRPAADGWSRDRVTVRCSQATGAGYAFGARYEELMLQ